MFRNTKLITVDGITILSVEAVPPEWKDKKLECRLSNAAGSASTQTQMEIDTDSKRIQAGTFEVVSTQSRHERENVEALLIGDSFAEVASLLSGSTLSLIETVHVESTTRYIKKRLTQLTSVFLAGLTTSQNQSTKKAKHRKLLDPYPLFNISKSTNR